MYMYILYSTTVVQLDKTYQKFMFIFHQDNFANMISLKDVLRFFLISVYARNIVIFCVHPDDPVSSQISGFIDDPKKNSINVTELASKKGNMILAESSCDAKIYFGSAKSINDFELKTINGDTILLGNTVQKDDIILFVHIDPTNSKLAKHIKDLNIFYLMHGKEFKIFGILTKKLSDSKLKEEKLRVPSLTNFHFHENSIEQIYNRAKFILCDPADDLWSYLLLNNTDQYKDNNQIKIHFSKLFVVHGRIIQIVEPSVVVKSDIIDDILSKRNIILSEPKPINYYRRKVGKDIDTRNILSFSDNQHHILLLYIYIDPTDSKFKEHINYLNILDSQKADKFLIIGILTERAGSFEEVRELCTFKVYDPAYNLWDILISNAPHLYKHDRSILTPFTKFFVLNGKVIEIFDSSYILRLDMMTYIGIKGKMIEAGSWEEPKESIQPYESIYDYHLRYGNFTFILKHIVKENDLVLYANIDPDYATLYDHIETLNNVYLKMYEVNIYIIGIISRLTDTVEDIKYIRYNAKFLVFDSANDLWDILCRKISNDENNDYHAEYTIASDTIVLVKNGIIFSRNGTFTAQY